MKAKIVMDHLCGLATWLGGDKPTSQAGSYPVDPGWPGPDSFLFGDPDIELTGIAVAWIATNRVLREAAAIGHNLFICHEPAFYQGPGYQGTPLVERMAKTKMDLLGELGMTLLRCHDMWDRMPEMGIQPQRGKERGKTGETC